MLYTSLLLATLAFAIPNGINAAPISQSQAPSGEINAQQLNRVFAGVFLPTAQPKEPWAQNVSFNQNGDSVPPTTRGGVTCWTLSDFGANLGNNGGNLNCGFQCSQEIQITPYLVPALDPGFRPLEAYAISFDHVKGKRRTTCQETCPAPFLVPAPDVSAQAANSNSSTEYTLEGQQEEAAGDISITVTAHNKPLKDWEYRIQFSGPTGVACRAVYHKTGSEWSVKAA
ncbi:hypothetical protein DFJ77DRAFT_303536 [Powellomyces hirtus]|nr:hypothetical protein DFJ77DRAFT_303536 [Powellomyces hirtus]